jgi:hypothetical protein
MRHAPTLAALFADIVQRWTTPEEFARIRELNAGPYKNDDCCATHDVFDANEAMAEAFELHTGFAIDADEEDQCKLWNEAWSIAKKDHLS